MKKFILLNTLFCFFVISFAFIGKSDATFKCKFDQSGVTYFWVTGSGTTNNELYQVLDDNPNGCEDNDVAGHYIGWSTWIDETVHNRVYVFQDYPFELGDGSTSTTLNLENMLIYLPNKFEVQSNATLNIGQSNGDYGINGCGIIFDDIAGTSFRFSDGGDINIYDSKLHNAGTHLPAFQTGNIVIRNSTLSAERTEVANIHQSWWFLNTLTSVDIDRLNIVDTHSAYVMYLTPTQSKDILLHKHRFSIIINNASSAITLEDLNITEYLTWIVTAYSGFSGNQLYIKNPKGDWSDNMTASNISLGTASQEVHIQYDADMTVMKDGSAVSGVSVYMYDKDGTEEFEELTDADGQIPQQTWTRRKWVGTSETKTDHSAHTIGAKKVDLRTIETSGVTVAEKINWFIEMEGIQIPPGWGP